MKVRIKEIENRTDYSYVTNKGFVIGQVYEVHDKGEEDKGVVIIDGDKRCFLYEDEYEVVE